MLILVRTQDTAKAYLVWIPPHIAYSVIWEQKAFLWLVKSPGGDGCLIFLSVCHRICGILILCSIYNHKPHKLFLKMRRCDAFSLHSSLQEAEIDWKWRGRELYLVSLIFLILLIRKGTKYSLRHFWDSFGSAIEEKGTVSIKNV